MPVIQIGASLTRGGPLRWPSFFLGLGGLLLGGYAATVQAYSGVADVTLSWGETANPITWSWRFQNALTVVSNETLFQALQGSNQVSYLNSDFASPVGCSSAVLALDGSATGITARKYGCRYLTVAGEPRFVLLPSPPTDVGPAGAQATGTLFFTDTTLTGVLAVGGTTDEPTGGDALSVGDGANGFNVRTEDRSPFGGAWYGVSTGATLTVDLTGDFSAAGWEITGGTVRLSDPAFRCQQGGIGGAAPFFILCDPGSTLPGTYSSDGSHLSFGIDADGGAGAGTLMREIEIWDGTGTSIVATLSGVLASLTVGPAGTLSTTSGEYRSGRVDGNGCTSKIRWTGDRISCGILTVGPLQITGTATPVDTEPDPFTFSAVINVALGTLVTSNAITISGIAAPARTTVSGGQYSVGCTGTFTSAASNVSDGATICVRHTSAATPETNTVTTLNVGGITGTFTSTTEPADIAQEPFTFVDQTNVALSTLVTSSVITITGINGAAAVSVTGGEYSVGCNGTFTAAAGSVTPGQSLCVRHTSAALSLSSISTTLTVGGVSDTFTSTTIADTVPDGFTFVDQADVTPASLIVSAPVAISGLTAAATVVVVNGQYSINCTGPFTAVSGSVSDGQTICVRHTSAAANSATVNTTLTVGSVADTFTSTTVAAVPPDTTPDPFAFQDQTGVGLAVTVTSAAVSITGLTGAASVTVSGGTYSVGCTATYVSTPGSVANNQTVCVRHTSAAANSVPVSTTLTVGGVADTFTSTTVAAVPPDTTPDPFVFPAQSGVPLSTTVTSAPVIITGINGAAAVSVTGGEYSVGCNDPYTAAAGSVTNNQTLCVRHTSAAANSNQTITTLTVGGTSATFTSSTAAAAVGGGGGGGGGAVNPFMLAVLLLLPAWRRRLAAMH